MHTCVRIMLCIYNRSVAGRFIGWSRRRQIFWRDSVAWATVWVAHHGIQNSGEAGSQPIACFQLLMPPWNYLSLNALTCTEAFLSLSLPLYHTFASDCNSLSVYVCLYVCLSVAVSVSVPTSNLCCTVYLGAGPPPVRIHPLQQKAKHHFQF